MRLAVFTNQFPGRFNTFFARDMRALIDCGIDVEIYPIYPLDAANWTAVPDLLGPAVLARQRVHHLTPAEVARALPRGAGHARKSLRIVAASARYGPLPAAKAAYAAAYASAQARRFDGRPFDHVLAYWGNYAASAAYLFHAATQPGIPFSMFAHARMDLYRHPAYLAQKLLYADNIFVVCEYNRRYLQHHYPKEYPRIAGRIRVHHLGMPLDQVPFEPEPRPPARLLSVGHLEPLKGFRNLIDAFAVLRSRGVDAHLELVGDGPERAALQARADRLHVADRVTFHGPLPSAAVLDAMRRATILVHPPVSPDAMPTVIKEAMAVGTPVIASDLAGIPEMLDGGRCGTLVPPGDVMALTAAIETVLADPARRRAHAVAARGHMEDRFDLWRNGRLLAERLRATTRPALASERPA